ncbi:hypothetical protein Slin14017_G086670 [Septoria linicola]|nr:hypothetical protein Slin14017_G086670 [Septoria linicola]
MNQDDCAVAYFGANIKDLQDSYAQTRLLGACGNLQDADLGCLVQGGQVQLFYFPEQVEGADTCGNDDTPVSPTESPQPITTLGTTFQPGSVYLSFSTLYAAYRPSTGLGGEAAQIGPTFSNTILAFRENEPTATAQPGFGPGTQLNYADLNSPVAASAYACQNQCRPHEIVRGDDGNITSKSIFPNPSNTIFDNSNPLLAVPTKLREMVPEWSSCSFWNDQNPNIIFDPPTALRQAGQAAGPTLPGVITSTAAAPSVTIPPVVSATGPTLGQPTLPVPTQPAASTPTRQSSAPPINTALPEELPSSSPSAVPQPQQPSSAIAPVPQQPPSLEIPSAASQPQLPSSAVVPPAAPQQGSSTAPIAPVRSSSANPPQQAPDTSTTSAPVSRPPGASQTQPVIPVTCSSSSSLPVAPSPVLAQSQSSLLVPDPGSSQNTGEAVTDAATSAAILSALQEASSSGGSGLVLTADGVIITASAVSGQSGVVEVDGSTFSTGASAVTIDGQVASMGSEGVVEVSGTALPGSDSAKTTEASDAATGSRTMAHSTTSTFSPLQQPNGAELSRAVHLTSLVCVAVVVTFLRHVL